MESTSVVTETALPLTGNKSAATADALPLETAQLLTTVMATPTPKNRPMMLMDKARAEASFDSRLLTYFLYGG